MMILDTYTVCTSAEHEPDEYTDYPQVYFFTKEGEVEYDEYIKEALDHKVHIEIRKKFLLLYELGGLNKILSCTNMTSPHYMTVYYGEL